MKRIKQTSFVLAMSLLLAVVSGCSKGESGGTGNGGNTPVTPNEQNLSFVPKVAGFTPEAGSITITVRGGSGAISTKIEPADASSWLTATVKDDKITVTVSKSDRSTARTADIVVTRGNATAKLPVNQLGSEPQVLINPSYIQAVTSGGLYDVTITANVDYTLDLSGAEWVSDATPATRAIHDMVAKEHKLKILPHSGEEARRVDLPIVPVDEKLKQPVVLTVFQDGLKDYKAGTVGAEELDIKVPVKGGNATSFQQGGEFEKSFDGDYSTLYHSNWNNSPANYFPITLTYNFEPGTMIDYIVYHPRKKGNDNGNIKDVNIKIVTNKGTVDLGDFNFKGTKVPTRVELGGGEASETRAALDNDITEITSVIFTVKSGSGDGQGFVACSEMEFYRYNPERFVTSTIFADEACTALKPGVTDNDIAKIQSSLFRNMAYYMKVGKYPREFRIEKYKAYPHPNVASAVCKNNPYSLLDNPTGIAKAKGEKLIVLVGDTHGYDISVRIQELEVQDKPENQRDGFNHAQTFALHKGMNVIDTDMSGLIYVLYHTPEYKSAEPITIHFPGGTVNGYFDMAKHKPSEWKERLEKATNANFDVLGEFAHLTFPVEKFKKNVPDIKPLIDAYDLIVKSEMELMGLYKYDRVFKNRMYLHVMYHSYMYATSYHTGYNYTTLDAIMNADQLVKKNVWGPAHEIGHMNQTRPGFLWRGMTEVTNNVMSQYIEATVMKAGSRLQNEDFGDVDRTRYGKAWNLLMVPRNFMNINENGGMTDVFCNLVPFWQLELYFGNVLGRTPLQQSDKGGFYPDLYELIRTNPNAPNSGTAMLEFTYFASKAAKMDLTDFFEKWGFYKTIDIEVNDYSKEKVTVTQDMVDKVKARIKALGYQKPTQPIEYITDNTVPFFKSNAPVVKGTATKVAKAGTSRLTMKDWKNVVIYEVTDANGKILQLCEGRHNKITGTDVFELNAAVIKNAKDSFKVFAVGPDGGRVEVTFQ